MGRGLAKRARIGGWVLLSMIGTSSTRAAAPPVPAARTVRLSQTRLLSYPLAQVWPTTIRYLRVDRGYGILDRDPEAGFVLFEVPVSPDRVARGSVEFVVTKDSAGRDGVQVEVSVDGGASHLPFTLLSGIAAKLKEERGSPAPPPPPTAPPPPPPEESWDALP